jgi:23S rRNA (cytidine2498-2'-O)-methyltransferase
MDLFLTARGWEDTLVAELRLPADRTRVILPGVIAADPGLDPIPTALVFSRQWLPGAEPIEVPSIQRGAEAVSVRLMEAMPGDGAWRFHAITAYGERGAGANRCRLLTESVLEHLGRRRRQLVRAYRESTAPWEPAEGLAQFLLTSPDRGFLSVTPPPGPHGHRRILWPFAGGDIPWATDKQAPSRAFEKLVEAEQRLGCRIGRDETCVDLGASPGSWTYVALGRGARVIAVDRSPLREDMMRHREVTFVPGDVFRFTPERPVDWLLCDVIAAPERSSALALEWIRQRVCRRFVVTLKFQGPADLAHIETVKSAMAATPTEWFLVRLSANRNEACLAGTLT